MTKYTATIAADVRAYATVTVEAANEDEAHDRFKAIAHAMNVGEPAPPEISGSIFDPDYSSLCEYEYLEDCGIDLA